MLKQDVTNKCGWNIVKTLTNWEKLSIEAITFEVRNVHTFM